MASGVKVADDVKTIFNEMKVVKTDSVQEERLRIVTFKIKDGFIEKDEICTEKQLEGKDIYKHFKSLLLPDKCCYLLYDCHYETKELHKKEDLIMATWCPEEAAVKEKMHYSSSKDALKRAFKGLKHDWQLNDLSDIDSPLGFADKLGGKIARLEGKDL